jgi:hypothetical protein
MKTLFCDVAVAKSTVMYQDCFWEGEISVQYVCSLVIHFRTSTEQLEKEYVENSPCSDNNVVYDNNYVHPKRNIQAHIYWFLFFSWKCLYNSGFLADQ